MWNFLTHLGIWGNDQRRDFKLGVTLAAFALDRKSVV